jgi:hypothetical protein
MGWDGLGWNGMELDGMNDTIPTTTSATATTGVAIIPTITGDDWWLLRRVLNIQLIGVDGNVWMWIVFVINGISMLIGYRSCIILWFIMVGMSGCLDIGE